MAIAPHHEEHKNIPFSPQQRQCTSDLKAKVRYSVQKKLPKATHQLLKDVMEKFNLSARAYNSICKLARTIADLAESPQIKENHVAEAVAYRSLDQEKWGD